jgi:hypothetical protein
VTPPYNGTARDQKFFSTAGRFYLIQAFEVKCKILVSI